MALHPDFPTDPYAILNPEIRWYPGDEMIGQMGYAMLLPPLVHKVRKAVAAWRESGYAGASPTTVTPAMPLVQDRAPDPAGGRHGAAVPVVFRPEGGRGNRDLAL